MQLLLATPLLSLTYIWLYITVLLLWCPKFFKIALWPLALVLAMVFGLLSHQVSGIGIINVILFMTLLYYVNKQHLLVMIRVVLGIVIVVVSFALLAHLLPTLSGFHNYKFLQQVYISQDAIPFTMYLNFDKAIVGILILGINHKLINSKQQWNMLIKNSWRYAVITIVVIVCLSNLFHFVRFDPKLSPYLGIWLITNLLFVCVAEEALFRGFIQKYLTQLLQRFKGGRYIALIISSMLFGVAHFPGGLLYVLLASIAGIGYGYIYLKSEYIESSILTHFLLNVTHFLFFTYPALSH